MNKLNLALINQRMNGEKGILNRGQGSFIPNGVNWNKVANR